MDMQLQHLKQLLSGSSYTVINKHLMKQIGLDATFMLQYLLDLQSNVFNGEFFQQQSRLSDEFGWSISKVKSVLKDLRDLGIIHVEKKGIPAKNYYVINSEVVMSILATKSADSKPARQQDLSYLGSRILDDIKQPNIKQNKNNKINKQNNIIDKVFTQKEVDAIFEKSLI